MCSSDLIVRKFRRAVTDSDSEIRYDPTNKPGVSNLLTIYSAFTGKDVKDCEKEFCGKDYAYLKAQVAEATAEGLRSTRENFERLSKQKDYLFSVMKTGAEKASYIARRTMSKVWRKLGFVRP